MTLLYDEETLPEGSYIDEMKRAAELACKEEGLDPDLCSVSISFVGPEEIRELNRDYRNTDKVTDVLSFPQCEDVGQEYEDFLLCRAELNGESDGEEDACSKSKNPAESDDSSGDAEAAEPCEAGGEDNACREVEEECEDFAEEDELFCLGDVVINLERAREQAAEFGHSVQREVVYLTVHSLFHLLGYDHMEEEDKKEMRAKEESVLAVMGITR